MCMCVCEVILFSCDVRFGGSNVNVRKHEYTEGRQRDARGTPGRTSDPFAVHQVPGLPRKSHRQSGGDQGMPEGRQRDARGTPEGRQRDARGTPKGRQRDARAYMYV